MGNVWDFRDRFPLQPPDGVELAHGEPSATRPFGMRYAVASHEVSPVEAGKHEKPTLLTNDAQAARAFAAGIDGPLVYKPPASRALIEQDQLRVIYTSVVDPADLDGRRVGVTTHLFQQWVDKAFDAPTAPRGNVSASPSPPSDSGSGWTTQTTTAPGVHPYSCASPPDGVTTASVSSTIVAGSGDSVAPHPRRRARQGPRGWG